jgi:hypothetical protein
MQTVHVAGSRAVGAKSWDDFGEGAAELLRLVKGFLLPENWEPPQCISSGVDGYLHVLTAFSLVETPRVCIEENAGRS